MRWILFLLLACVGTAFAADPPPACIEEKIAVEKLKQQNAQLLQQLMQLQFTTSQQQAETAKAEEARLQQLLPKKPVEKK